jgi:hypothetical protein
MRKKKIPFSFSCRPLDQAELIGSVRSYLRSMQRRPGVVRSNFQEEHVRYAAA